MIQSDKSQSSQSDRSKPNSGKHQYTHQNPPRILKRNLNNAVVSKVACPPKAQLKGESPKKVVTKKNGTQPEWKATGKVFILGPNLVLGA